MRERRGPVQVREDAEGHRLAPAAHQHRADEAEHQEQPDRRGEGPGHVRAHARALARGVYMRTHHSRIDTVRKHAGHQPPAALVQRRERQAVLRRRRLERQPEQLAHELHRVPVHLGQHVEADDVERQRRRRSARRCPAGRGRSARSAASPRRPSRCNCGRSVPVRGLLPLAERHAQVRRPDGLHLGEEFWYSAMWFSSRAYFSGHWPRSAGSATSPTTRASRGSRTGR